MFLDFVPLGWGYFGILASLLILVSEPPPSVLVGFGCDPLDNDHLMVASEEAGKFYKAENGKLVEVEE